ncbi:MAG: hypothetical protein JO097_18850 [Acidobacteriaceae bacterium]|nr:hypothetical protein [Acidobacteriaceae bacterium]
MLRLSLLLYACAALCCKAQEQVGPTPEQAGPTRGDDYNGYNIVNSFEIGYRFVRTAGNEDTYRSTENLSNGARLLSSFLTINSKNGHGGLFDEIVLTSEGLGGDPNSIVRLRAQKDRLYEYNFQWRRNEYFNPGLVTDGAAGLHLLNTSYTLQDHDLTLFPQSRIRFFLGYTRDTQGGAGISTVQLFSPGGDFDATGNVFPVFTNVKRVQNDYRLGGEVHWLGWTLNVMHGWEDFKDDSADQFQGTSIGDGFNSNTVLNIFGRTQPNHGSSPYWRAALFRNTSLLNINGRFTYTDGQRAFIDNESAIGVNRFGAASNQQIVSFGNARRPVTTGNLSASFYPNSSLSIVEQSSFYDIRTDGNSAYLQFDNATQLAHFLLYQYLGIRTFASDTDVIYRLRRWLNLHGGYEYSNRRIVASPQVALAGSIGTLPYAQTNELQSGTFGFRLRPLKPLTVSLDGEIGRASRPFTPKGDKDYSALVARVQYKFKALQLIASSRSDYNDNSVTLLAFSSHARTYSGSASWSPRSWFALDATYFKLHLDTIGGIQFFAGPQLLQNQVSYYVSNLHSGTIDVRFTLRKRLDFYFGYSRVQDTGDGRSSPFSTRVGPNLSAFEAAQTFPLTFQSPLARVSVGISERVRWNVAYQYFGYHTDFSPGKDYLANTGYSSISWSF